MLSVKSVVKILRFAFFAAFVFPIAGHAAEVLDVGRFLGAIRAVESGAPSTGSGRATPDGRAGERGPWQITAAVWSTHMPGVSFTLARDPATARVCGVRHLAWLRRELRLAGAADDVFNCALAWNAGLAAATHGRARPVSYDYAVRVENIYDQ